MTDLTLTAAPRIETGKGGARKARASGQVPAVIYSGGSDATSITVDPIRLEEIFRKTRDANTIVQLQLGAETILALVQEAQRHPVSREIIHVDFFRVADGSVVRVKVPISTTGRAAGAAVGGRIRIMARTLPVECAFDKIPASLPVDVTPLEVGQFLRASQVPMPEGVKSTTERDFNVVTCEGKVK